MQLLDCMLCILGLNLATENSATQDLMSVIDTYSKCVDLAPCREILPVTRICSDKEVLPVKETVHEFRNAMGLERLPTRRD